MENNENIAIINKLENDKQKIIKYMSKCEDIEKLKLLNNKYMETITKIYEYKYIITKNIELKNEIWENWMEILNKLKVFLIKLFFKSLT